MADASRSLQRAEGSLFSPAGGKTMSMPTCEPGQRLLDEQDYVQAYENVREKYKGNSSSLL